MNKTKIAGIEFNSCIFNASGPRDSTLDELIDITESESSAITMKSCTIKPRKGNKKPRYARLPFGAIQCMGLPNLGYKAYINFASKLKKYKKPIIASVAGLSLDDYKIMVGAFQDSDVDLIEVNISCPNIDNKIIAYDFKQTKEVLSKIYNLGEKPIGLKLPQLRLHEQIAMAELITKYNISFITCINSIADTLAINQETETTIIKPKKGLGSLSGESIKPIALGQVRIFYESLKDEISIIGVGGITTGKDVFDYLLAGADAVQIGTIFEEEGISCFKRINKELEEILKGKGYSSIQEIKGKLKYL